MLVRERPIASNLSVVKKTHMGLPSARLELVRGEFIVVLAGGPIPLKEMMTLVSVTPEYWPQLFQGVDILGGHIILEMSILGGGAGTGG